MSGRDITFGLLMLVFVIGTMPLIYIESIKGKSKAEVKEFLKMTLKGLYAVSLMALFWGTVFYGACSQ